MLLSQPLEGECSLSQETRLSLVLLTKAILCKPLALFRAVGLGVVCQKRVLQSPHSWRRQCAWAGGCACRRGAAFSADCLKSQHLHCGGLHQRPLGPPSSQGSCAASHRHPQSWPTFDFLTPRYSDQRSYCSWQDAHCIPRTDGEVREAGACLYSPTDFRHMVPQISE